MYLNISVGQKLLRSLGVFLGQIEGTLGYFEANFGIQLGKSGGLLGGTLEVILVVLFGHLGVSKGSFWSRLTLGSFT